MKPIIIKNQSLEKNFQLSEISQGKIINAKELYLPLPRNNPICIFYFLKPENKHWENL